MPLAARVFLTAGIRRELGLRSLSFEVDDLQAQVDRLATEGYGLGGIGQYEGIWRMACMRGQLRTGQANSAGDDGGQLAFNHPPGIMIAATRGRR